MTLSERIARVSPPAQSLARWSRLRRETRPAALLAAVALAAGACRTAGRERPGAQTAQPADSTVQEQARAIPLDVQNNYRADVTILLVRGGQRRRLGTVPPSSRRLLLVPASFAGDQGGFALLADPVAGSGSVLSQTVVVRAGQRLVWTLESRLSRSVLAVE